MTTWTADAADDLVLALDLPEVWEEVSVDPDVEPSWVAELGAAGIDEEAVHRLRVALRTATIEARAEGLVWAASFVAPVGAGGPDARTLAASAFLAVRDPGPLDGVLSSVLWVAAFEDADQRRDLRLLKPPSMLAIGDLDVAKAVYLTTLPATPQTPPIDVVDVTFYVTVPECPSIVALGFRTPSTWVAEEMEALFDDIASTLRVGDAVQAPDLAG